MTYQIRKDKHNQFYWVACDDVNGIIQQQGEYRHPKLQAALDDSTAHNGEQEILYVGREYED